MPELSVVLPTFNERDNLPVITELLRQVLADVDYEVVVVDDDSPDGTADLAREMAQTDPRIRVVHRINRRGLSSACVEGMLATSSPFIAVMDADLQHDETILPKMLARIKSEALDLVVGTRHADGGGMGQFASGRVALSEAGRFISRLVSRAELSDPMSGFFLLRRSFLNEVAHSLSSIGFKILLDLVASSRRPVRVAEVGYQFRNRTRGESKLDILVGVEYFQLLADKLVGRFIPVGYIMFAAIGTLGLIVNLSLVGILILAGMEFLRALTVSSLAVIGLNFLLNNMLTFRSSRLRGTRMITGLIAFYVACSIGLVANVQFAEKLAAFSVPWHLASLGGIVLASVWNYWVSSVFVWRVNRRSSRTRAAAYATV
jgi:dolichol-phosphate mannosyltransferase